MNWQKNTPTISQNSRTPFLSWANRILYSTKNIQEQKNNVNLQCLYSQTLFNGLHKV